MVLNSLTTDTVEIAEQTRPEYYSPMREEHPSTNQRMSLVPGHLFEPLQQRIVDPFRTELDDELIVVNCGLFAVFGDRALDVPRCDDLLVGRSL